MLYENTVAPAALGLLKELMQVEALQSFALVGGTNLSLRLGQRYQPNSESLPTILLTQNHWFNMKNCLFFLLLLGFQTLFAQKEKELELINQTLLDYIEGTTNGEPERVKRAFHPDFNLYYVAADTLTVWDGGEYVAGIKEGQKANRIGRVVSVDWTGNAAVAKIEIDMPQRKRLYTDYLILLKYEGQWRIIHKSFTWVEYRKE